MQTTPTRPTQRRHTIRSESDRRTRDIGPPGKMADRRHKAERRLPELSDMPFEEFEAELAAMGKPLAEFLSSSSSSA